MVDEPPLSGTHYDRAALHRTDDAWLADAWTRAQVVLVTPDSKTPVVDGRLAVRTAGDAPDGPRRFLGLVGEVPYFAVTAAEPDSDGWQTPREFGARADDLDASLMISAVALEQWHQRHGHCPRCGAPAEQTQAGWTRTCTRDGSVHFPRTDPAVIMLITSEDDGQDLALLGRGQQWGPGRFSTLAGFVEPGESLEAAVAREVFEEVGVGVRDVRYLASQPWPFPASLMLGFVARLDGDPSIVLDPVEMAEAGWFTRDDVRRAADWTDELVEPQPGDDSVRLRGIPPHFSISRYLIDRWLAHDV
ncbi:NAD(+) diphosphatase [uncultured Jatrophihabitans sp.]|uniref:NAD(+) diphosphatase n=1 Tax=uncultured Jatrophihabitans sp. TaxID=1610747 RepID=UPI0035CA9526